MASISEGTSWLETKAYIEYKKANQETIDALFEHSKVFSEAKALYSVSPTGDATRVMAKKLTSALAAYKAAIAKEEVCARAAGIHSRVSMEFV